VSSEVPAELWSYEGDLNRYARYLCRQPEDAEDVAHNALLKAAEHIGGFRGEASMRTWLHTIVTNECRMLRRRTTSVSLDQFLEDGAGDDQPPVELTGDQPDPIQGAEEAELRQLALGTLRQMPAHYRTALFLRVALRQSVEQVASALGRSVPATKSILYRARASMREGVAAHLDRDADSG
jgi:RNA polymerase sigma-70 factor (ECF subfamily)